MPDRYAGTCFCGALAIEVHLNHAVLAVRDGLPKLRDFFSARVGGSGERIPE